MEMKSNFDPPEKDSAFVVEAKKLMQDDDEMPSARQQMNEATGGIRMNKIGKAGRKKPQD